MMWMQLFIAVACLLCLVGIMAILHGATLVYKDLHCRRSMQYDREEQKSMSAKHAA